MSERVVEVEVELSDTLAVDRASDRGARRGPGVRVPARPATAPPRRDTEPTPAGGDVDPVPALPPVPADERLVALVLGIIGASADGVSRTGAVVDKLERAGHARTYSDVLWALRVAEYRGQLTSAPAPASNANSGPGFRLVPQERGRDDQARRDREHH